MTRLAAKTAGITSVMSHVSGGDNWVQLPASRCDWMQITNDTGFDLEFRYVGVPSETFPVLAGAAQAIVGINAANQVEWRRRDGVATQVKIKAYLIIE